MSKLTDLHIELTDSEREDVVELAGYGIGYWAESIELKDGKVIVKPMDEPVRVVDVEALDRAVETLFRANLLPGWFERELLADDFCGDSDVADMIIQQAIFAEIIYG